MRDTSALLRLLAFGVAAFAFAGCGGGSSSNPIGGPGFGTQCDPGTQVQLASPQAGNTGVSGNIGQVIVVANGNQNTLGVTYNQWKVILTDNFGNLINGGLLNLVALPNGPHPYSSDFYYASSLPALPGGRTWNAQLIQASSNCNGYPLFGFST